MNLGSMSLMLEARREQPTMDLDPWLLQHLVCPRDRQKLCAQSDRLICPSSHEYPVIHGIPVMLLREVQQTHAYATRSLDEAEKGLDEEILRPGPCQSGAVDPFVQQEISATNGIMYRSLVGKLVEYPIPALAAPDAHRGYFLDIGCNWGRWCIAARRLGYMPVGIDVSLHAILAARRVAQQLGVDAIYLVADSRYMPFEDLVFDHAFSYGVLQHFDKGNACRAVAEMNRVLKVGATGRVQMPNRLGLRCLYHQLRRRFREPTDFEVRYWSLPELKTTFQRIVGCPTLSADGFLSLNPQPSDVHLLPFHYRLVIGLSELLKKTSTIAPFLIHLADSVYVTARKCE
jgi:uncharacterized protein YbaR (Trm112 family)